MPSEVTGAPPSSGSQGGKEAELARMAAALAAASMLLRRYLGVNYRGSATTCCYVRLRVLDLWAVWGQVYFVVVYALLLKLKYGSVGYVLQAFIAARSSRCNRLKTGSVERLYRRFPCWQGIASCQCWQIPGRRGEFVDLLL